MSKARVRLMSNKKLPNYLKFYTDSSEEVSVKLAGNTNLGRQFQRSRDGKNWETYLSTDNVTITAGNPIYLRGVDNGSERFSYSSSYYYKFTLGTNGNVFCSGNIMSLLGEIGRAHV